MIQFKNMAIQTIQIKQSYEKSLHTGNRSWLTGRGVEVTGSIVKVINGLNNYFNVNVLELGK